MTAYMSIDYRILHSYVACKTNNDHKNTRNIRCHLHEKAFYSTITSGTVKRGDFTTVH